MSDIYIIGLFISAFMLTADSNSFTAWVVWEIAWIIIAGFFGYMLSREEENE